MVKHIRRILFSVTLPSSFGMMILLFSLNMCQKFEPKGFLYFTTETAQALDDGSYKLNGTIDDIGQNAISDHGFCWSEQRDPTITGSSSSEGQRNSPGNFSSTVSGLLPNTTYYYKAYVTSSAGTEYAKEKSFITDAFLPSVTTSPIESITQTSAQGGGNVTDDGGAWVSDRGICWSTSQNPEITNKQSHAGEGMGSFTGMLTDLSPHTTYFVRAYAINSVGIRYGNEVSFDTPDNAKPTAGFMSDKTTIVEGESVLFSDQSTNAPTSWEWDFGDGGSSTQQNPTHTYNSAGTYTVTLTASNSYGNDIESKPGYITVIEATVGIVTDREGNNYNTVKIGNQWWLAENLRATRYNDNTAIPLVTNGNTWSNLSTPGYCWYNNDPGTSDYGALYNWQAVNTSKLCPSGWHVPSDAEWRQLELFIGMSEELVEDTGQRGDLGGELKETGFTHWDSPNFRATDNYGFGARGTGLRKHDGTFLGQGQYGDFWTATEDVSGTAWVHGMAFDDDYIWRAMYGQEYGFPVRCVKD